MNISVNIIGAGNLGKTIGYLLVKQKLIDLVSICNRSECSSLLAIDFIGQGSYCPISELPPVDLTFITTPDDVIPDMGTLLSKNPLMKPGSVVLHCSGVLSSDVLMPLKESGCYLASVHPMTSFAKPALSIQHFAGTFCALEGDEEAIPRLRSLFQALGAITYTIDKSKKSAYHAAGVFASNYLVTLAEQALVCMREAGVESDLGMRVILSLMRSTVSNLEHSLSPVQSLTGPIKRGDVTTLLRHLAALKNKEQKHLYAVLAKAALQLTDHDQLKKDSIEAALTL